MGTVVSLWDKLSNALSGVGTGRDVRSANAYTAIPKTQAEIAAAYSGSGLIRKIVQIPAQDMVREWREWSGLDGDQAAAMWDAEKRLMLRQKIRQVEILRGLGGGAIIMGLPGEPSQEAPKSVGKDGLAYLNVVSRWHLTFDRMQDDARLGGYGEPAMWTLNTTTGRQAIHPSRVIPFRADTSASLAMPSWSGADAFWGESTVAQVLEAVQDSDTARAAFAALVNKARLLRIGIPRLTETASSAGGESAISQRMAIVAMAESIHNATIYDAGDEDGKGGEEIKDATYSFAGAKDIMNALAEFVAAVSDIPATRLLGRAPEGMNSSGDSQQRDWIKKVRAMQTLDLAPCLDRIDRYLVQSAIGSVPPEAAYEFAPLDVPTEAERATTFKTIAEAADKISAGGFVPEVALNRGIQSWLVQEGVFPELEAALADLPDDERYGIEPDEDSREEVIEPSAEGEVAEEVSPLRRAANDAQPRPLYVHRKLLNSADLVKWAKAQGFQTTLPAADMHVTVLYSRNAVDPMAMGDTWTSDPDGGLTIKAGGPRALERFGEGAVVLQFASWSLESRHREMVERGASHDFPEYSPHVTLTYSAGDLDLETIRPFTGELRFGPEIFEPLDEDWKAKIEEA